MTRAARANEVIEIIIPVSDVRKHEANKQGLLEVIETIAQDNFSRAQEALSRKFYGAAAVAVFLGAVGATGVLLDPTHDKEKKNLLALGSAFSAAVFLYTGRLTRPHIQPLSEEDRSNLDKERQGRQDRYNAFYRRYFEEAPSLYVNNQHLV